MGMVKLAIYSNLSWREQKTKSGCRRMGGRWHGWFRNAVLAWGVVPSGYRSSNTIAATEKKWLWGAVDSLSLEARGRCLYWTSYQIKYVVVVSIYDAVDLKKAYRRVVTFFLSTHSTFTISSSRRFAHKSHHWTERSLDLSRNMDPRAIF